MTTLRNALFSVSLLLSLVSAAAAQPSLQNTTPQDLLASIKALGTLGTPDGIPPAFETICDGQTGAAHGLCTAYCEAMDCDSPKPHASAQACAKIANNFVRITGQPLPCDCPCVGRISGFIESLNGRYGYGGCTLSQSSYFSVVEFATSDPFYVLVSGFDDNSGIAVCGESVSPGPGGFLDISRAQAEACVAITVQKLAAAGVRCTGGQ
jgi:hypothetical protein